jgi:hypothetical protein
VEEEEEEKEEELLLQGVKYVGEVLVQAGRKARRGGAVRGVVEEHCGG